MPPSAVRGKALVASLRKRPDVRDAEALAAWIGRVKKYKRMGIPVARAHVLAKVAGGSEFARDEESVSSKAQRYEAPDPFSEDYGEGASQSDEEAQMQKYGEQQLRQLEKQMTSELNNAILDAGGIQTRAALREEYRNIPNNFIRTDGLRGDEMADHLKTYFPEFGVEDENDLLSFFEKRYRGY